MEGNVRIAVDQDYTNSRGRALLSVVLGNPRSVKFDLGSGRPVKDVNPQESFFACLVLFRIYLRCRMITSESIVKVASTVRFPRSYRLHFLIILIAFGR